MLNNVVDFGATGNGTADDRDAIQAAIVNAVSNNKGGIFFPAGVYRVSRLPGNKRASIDLNGVQDFMIMGEGPKSVVKLLDIAEFPPANPRGDWHVFLLRNCQKVVFKDLVIDGNRPRLTTFEDEQYQGIEVGEATEDIVVDRCILRECFGDGIRLVGEANKNAKRLRIENCLFQKNKRSGISVQRETEQIIIANCVFDANEDDNSIDIEPSDLKGVTSDVPMDVAIQGCIINHTNEKVAVHLSGISGRQPLFQCKFSDNILVGGPIFCEDVNQLTIQNNFVHVTKPDFGQRIPVDVERGGESVMISGNVVVDDSGAEAVIRLSEANSRQVTRALVANNLCFAHANHGIYCEGSDDVAIQGNMIVATNRCEHGIFLRALQSPMDHISVRDNDITAKGRGRWKAGVKIAANKTDNNPGNIGHVSVIGNAVRFATVGVSFENKPFTQTPVCALNRIAAGVRTPLEGLTFLPENSVVVGGATNRGGPKLGGGRIIVGTGVPNRKVILGAVVNVGVTGSVGDIFQRLDGEPGNTFYVKEKGKNTKTGWIPK